MVENVFLIGIDGAGRSIFRAPCANMDAFRKTAVTACNACTVVPTISAQCWGSMFLSVLPEQHGYTNENLSARKHEMDDAFPSLLRIIKEQKPDWNIASFSAWEPINHGIVEDLSGAVKQSGKDDLLTQTAACYIRENKGPMAFFLHLDDLDHAGHQFDYFTPAYMDVLRHVDGNVGKILDAIDASGRRETSLIVIVTDHGGGAIPKSHGTDQPADLETFILASGGTLARGVSLTRRVSILDVAPVVLKQLGIAPPAHMLGDPSALDVE